MIKNILVPLSGGKDSQVSLMLAQEQYPNANIVQVFNDTGWEHPLTYEHLDYLQDKLKVKIERTVAGKKVQQRMLQTEFGKQRLKQIRELEIEISQKYEMYDTDQGSCEICNI